MKKLLSMLFLTLFTIFVVYPVIFIVLGTIMGGTEVKEYLSPLFNKSTSFATWSLLPTRPTLRFYVEIIFDTPGFFIMFWNSMKSVVFLCLGQTIISISAAWVLAIYDFKGKNFIICGYIFLSIVPFVVLMLPQYIILKEFQLLNTLSAIVIPQIFSTLPIIIMYAFFKKIPKELLDGARLDGASEIYIFFKIGIPLGKVGIHLAMLFSFIEQWGLFEQPLLFIEKKSLWTLPIFLTNIDLNFISLAFVSSMLSMIPPMLIMRSSIGELKKGIAEISIGE